MINPSKGSEYPAARRELNHQKMETEFKSFMQNLQSPANDDGIEKLFKELCEYIKAYDRILYSTISSVIYSRYDASTGKDKLSDDPCYDMNCNLEKLLNFVEDKEKMKAFREKNYNTRSTNELDNAKKTVYKIYDHASLALQQYSVLKQTDKEYREKFKQNIAEEKSELLKDMNSQMITMVGIFTALAFLIFGSISSLDGIFENIQFPLFKTLSIGLVWGLCVLNMIFVFLYCVSRMTNLPFKANDNKDASIFQKYPIVFWTNLILIVLLEFSLLMHFIISNAPGDYFYNMTYNYPQRTFFIGGAIIAFSTIGAFWFLVRKTDPGCRHEKKKHFPFL